MKKSKMTSGGMCCEKKTSALSWLKLHTQRAKRYLMISYLGVISAGLLVIQVKAYDIQINAALANLAVDINTNLNMYLGTDYYTNVDFYLPAGTFYTKGIYMAGNMHLHGYSTGSTIIKKMDSSPGWLICTTDPRQANPGEVSSNASVVDLTVDCAPPTGVSSTNVGGVNLNCYYAARVERVCVKNIRQDGTNVTLGVNQEKETFGINLATPLNGVANRAYVNQCEVRDAYVTNGGYATGIVLSTQYDGFDRFGCNILGADDWLVPDYYAGVTTNNYVHNLPLSHAYGAASFSRLLFIKNLSDYTGDAFNCDTSRQTSNCENVDLSIYYNTFSHCAQGVKIGSPGSGIGNTISNRLGADIWSNSIVEMVSMHQNVSYSNNNIAFALDGNTHNIIIDNNMITLASTNSSTNFCGVSQCWYAPLAFSPELSASYAWTWTDANYAGSWLDRPYYPNSPNLCRRNDNNDTVQVLNNTFSVGSRTFYNNIFQRTSDNVTRGVNNDPAVSVLSVLDN